MSAAYWSQWSHSEIMSMHGVELDECCEDEIDFDCEIEENSDDYEENCPRCTGSGCNYCLMCEW